MPRVRERPDEEDAVVLGIDQVPGRDVSDAEQHPRRGDKDGDDLDVAAHQPFARQPRRHTRRNREERAEGGTETASGKAARVISLAGAEQECPGNHVTPPGTGGATVPTKVARRTPPADSEASTTPEISEILRFRHREPGRSTFRLWSLARG